MNTVTATRPECKNVGEHSFAEFIDMATRFHNYPAPGLILGGYMVVEAKRHIPAGTLYEAIVETAWCLPDAVQMLTPCTLGNGWIHVLPFGRYALSLYDKYTGKGVRVWLDMHKLAPDSEFWNWYFKRKPKREQNSALLLQEIGEAGADVCSVRPVAVRPERLSRRSKGAIGECPVCHEAYPVEHGPVCRACRGEDPYMAEASGASGPVVYPLPDALRSVPAELAVGRKSAHDMTRIEPGKSKGPAFRKGQVFGGGDLCRLQRMGRNHLYVGQEGVDADWVHEDDCAVAFAGAMAGPGVAVGDTPREGKLTLTAACDGLLKVESDALYAFNRCPGVMAASRCGWTLVRKGAELAGTRAIPLYLQRDRFDQAMATLEQAGKPLFSVLPLRRAQVGVLITGNEVFSGRIEDRFEAVIRKKVTALGSEVRRAILTPDDRQRIRDNAQALLDEGCDLIITTAGLSVDPDDVTRQGLMDAGATDLLYGAPLLPGTMTLIGRIGQARLLGVPACALFFEHTSLDLLLPRLLADQDITRDDLARMGEGGMCLGCANCTFPKCPFGK